MGLQAFGVDHEGEPSKRLAADRPDPLAPVHALALQHAQALQIGEIYADAHVRAGSVRASA